MTEQEQPKNDFMHKLALQIVERRNLVFLIVILGTIFTIFSRSWVKVESDLTTYLPKTSETRMGLDIMEKEFTTYGSADVMVANITPDEADQLNDELAGLRGIQMIEYDDTTAHYMIPPPIIIMYRRCTPSHSITPRTTTSAWKRWKASRST